jgi:hypothetical protein
MHFAPFDACADENREGRLVHNLFKATPNSHETWRAVIGSKELLSSRSIQVPGE